MIFSEFMSYALYDPEKGYYTNKEHVLGQRGDFVTAPLLSPLFGSMLAKQIAEILMVLSDGAVLELGPGTGIMAAHILLSLEKKGRLPQFYYLLEISEVLKQKQKETITAFCPHLLKHCVWLNTFPQPGFEGVIVGNEYLDAFPVERFLFKQGQFLQSHVEYKNESWHESFLPSEDKLFLSAIRSIEIDRDEPFSEGYCSEVAPLVNMTIARLSKILKRGSILFIDYGFGSREYYHADRKEGTLMCHYQHRAHPNPFVHVGEQDITSHVNFTEVAKAAIKNGCVLSGYTTQADFLLSLGILEEAEIGNERERLVAAQALKKLLLPHEMGELFKVMALTKELNQPLLGFMQDKQHRL